MEYVERIEKIDAGLRDKTQIRDEGEKANESGGVLNPALLNMEVGE